jgi:hypothetical protein
MHHLPKTVRLMLMSDVHAPNFMKRHDSEYHLGKSVKFKAVSGSWLEKWLWIFSSLAKQ